MSTVEEMAIMEANQSDIVRIYRKYPTDMFIGAVRWVLEVAERKNAKEEEKNVD